MFAQDEAASGCNISIPLRLEKVGLSLSPNHEAMPICIECRYPVSQLYHVLHSRKPPPPPNSAHKASTPNLANSSTPKSPNAPRAPAGEAKKAASGSGGDVRLTQCPRCKRFADKYVEHDFVVLFIDLVLVKPQVSSLDFLPVVYCSSKLSMTPCPLPGLPPSPL